MAKIRHAGNTAIKQERVISVADLDSLEIEDHGVTEDLVFNNKNKFTLEVPEAVAAKLTEIDKKFERVNDDDSSESVNVKDASVAPSGRKVADRSDDVTLHDPNA